MQRWVSLPECTDDPVAVLVQGVDLLELLGLGVPDHPVPSGDRIDPRGTHVGFEVMLDRGNRGRQFLGGHILEHASIIVEHTDEKQPIGQEID